MSKEVLKLALAFIEAEGWGDSEVVITAIKEALAQPQQEPVAYWIPKAEQFCIADPSGRPFAKAWKPLYTSPPQRKPLTDEQVNLFINGRGDEDDDDYVEPTGDGFGLTAADLVRLVRRVEAAHGIKEKNT